ncbi:MAG TPA: hypothetical protein VKU41_20290 [Polyangiaceae bacterium]|nr:hypothetical protein [Polyangiaceae bacterium]
MTARRWPRVAAAFAAAGASGPSEDSTTTTLAGVTVSEAAGNRALVDLWLQGCGFPP